VARVGATHAIDSSQSWRSTLGPRSAALFWNAIRSCCLQHVTDPFMIIVENSLRAKPIPVSNKKRKKIDSTVASRFDSPPQLQDGRSPTVRRANTARGTNGLLPWQNRRLQRQTHRAMQSAKRGLGRTERRYHCTPRLLLRPRRCRMGRGVCTGARRMRASRNPVQAHTANFDGLSAHKKNRRQGQLRHRHNRPTANSSFLIFHAPPQ